MSEHDEQCALFDWANLVSDRIPELGMMFAIPNGGHRHKAVAGKMKAEGVKRGVPDIFLPVARHGFHGLFIEMKYGRNKPTKFQSAWFEKLEDQGYTYAVCWNWVQARDILKWYLDIK